MTIALIILGSFLALIFLIAWLVAYSDTIDGIKRNNDSYGYATYQRFVEEYNKVKWELDFTNSWILWIPGRQSNEYKYTTRITYNNMCFNDIGMLLRPIAWLRAIYYVAYQDYKNNIHFKENPWNKNDEEV